MRKKFLFICLSWLIALTANADNLTLYLTKYGLSADPNISASSAPYYTTDTSIEEGTEVTIRYTGNDNTTVLSIYINGEVVSSGKISRMKGFPYTFTAKRNCFIRVEGAYAFNFTTNPNVYFTQDVDVTGVTLSQTEAAMTVGGETLTLTATVAPANATNKTVTWTSSDESVATVANGVVTAVAAGTATITATATNGTAATGDDVSATCAVTVSTATYSVALKDGTEDATNWQGKAGEGEYQSLPLTGLEAGTAVTVKYNGTKKVKSVKAKKKQ